MIDNFIRLIELIILYWIIIVGLEILGDLFIILDNFI